MFDSFASPVECFDFYCSNSRGRGAIQPERKPTTTLTPDIDRGVADARSSSSALVTVESLTQIGVVSCRRSTWVGRRYPQTGKELTMW